MSKLILTSGGTGVGPRDQTPEGTARVLTREVPGIAEELLGEMLTEYDRPEINIQRDGDEWFVVRGTTPVHELNRELDLDLPTSPQWSTIAGLLIHQAGEIPIPGQRFTLEDEVEAEVLDATSRGVKVLRLRRLAGETPELG